MSKNPTYDLVIYRPQLAAEFYTLAQLAPMLGLQPASLRQRIARGQMDGQKVGTTWTVTRPMAWALLLEANRANVTRHLRREKEGQPYETDMGHAACVVCQRQRQEDAP